MKRYLLVVLAVYSSATIILSEEFERNVSLNDPLYSGVPTKSDFVMRWHYQYFCDHVYDPRTDIWRWPTDEFNGVSFDPSKVEPGATIFVRMIPKFFKEMHPRIKVPYIIVSAGECLDKMKPEYEKYLNQEKVIAWFGVHPDMMAMSHLKFHPLPLGILQHPDYYAQRAKLDRYFRRLRIQTQKKYWVYMNFAYSEKPEREKLRDLMINKPFCKKAGRLEFKDYLWQMAECKFTFSPEGLGPDCYRTWEALLVGTIPIVRRSHMDPLYEGLPVLIVDRWEDIDEPFLEKAYQEIYMKKYDIRRLYTDFWTDRIREIQEQFLKKLHQETHETAV